jgi:uncharacterized membrane protein
MSGWQEIARHVAPWAVGILALAHLGLSLKEWFGGKAMAEDPAIFGLPDDAAAKMAAVLKNAGFYNLGVAVGLGISYATREPNSTLFFIAFVIAAGLVGFWTLPRKVGVKALIAQSVLGTITLLLVLGNRS